MADEESALAFGEALERLLTDEKVPSHLLYHLSDIAGANRSLFEARWPTADAERRRQIVRLLVDITEDDYVVDFSPVFGHCLLDENPAVRVASLDGLWDATDVALIDPIVDRLNADPVSEVRAAAAGALAHYLLMSSWGELRGVPTDVIYEALMAAYNGADTPLAVRRVALEALGSVSSPAINKIIEEAYDNEDRGLQLSALFAMGTSADPRWLPVLLDELDSPIDDVRLEAARALGTVGDESAVSRLAELAYDEDEGVAQAAIVALGEIGGDHAQEILFAMLEDSDLEHLEAVIDASLEDASWTALDIQYGLLFDELADEEE